MSKGTKSYDRTAFFKRLFKRKTKEEKIVLQLKKKQKKIDALKEEMKKMASKLKFENGKLVKAESEPKQSQEPNPFEQQSQAQQQQQMQQQQSEQLHTITPPQMPPQQMQQQMPPQQMQQQMPPQMQQQMQQQMPQQQMQQQAPSRLVEVNVVLTTGENLPVTLEQDQVQAFLNELAERVDNKTSMQIGRRIINTRHILYFEF
jgi:hypothetical protein